MSGTGTRIINYLRLPRLPRYDEGWQPVMDALRGGKFFVTTGAVLIRDCRLGGKHRGKTLFLSGDEKPELRVDLDWTLR